MKDLPQIIDLYGPEVIIQEKTKNSSIFKMKNETGQGVMTSYQVFPGIQLIYNDIHMEYSVHNKLPIGEWMEINHCKEGRFECEFANGTCSYLEQGDLAVNMLSNMTTHSSFPLAHYHGCSIVINLTEVTEKLSYLLGVFSINLYDLKNKLCSGDRCFIMRAKDTVQHIFTEFYILRDQVEFSYFKVKVIELLVFLKATNFDKQYEKRQYFQKSQVDIIKEMKKYMVGHIDKHLTLEELAEGFNLPITAMKHCFKGVYGTSIYAYMRSYRMKKAAQMLRETSYSITMIAGKVGYENASKFSAAFKAIMYTTPLEYRKNYRLNRANLSEWSGK